MYIAARPFLVLLRTPAESFENACSYMQICMLGNFFVFEYNAISSVLNGKQYIPADTQESQAQPYKGSFNY